MQSVGLKIERRQERVFRNRYGTDIYEDILHFRSSGEVPDDEWCMAVARKIAKKVLSASRRSAPLQERPGIRHAMDRLEETVPSPMPDPDAFSASACCQ